MHRVPMDISYFHSELLSELITIPRNDRCQNVLLIALERVDEVEDGGGDEDAFSALSSVDLMSLPRHGR
jgi:hypothetical protein